MLPQYVEAASYTGFDYIREKTVYSRFGDTAFQKILVESQPARAVLDKAQEEIAEIMRK